MAQWNQKANKCKLCGKKSDSVIQGMVHLWLMHNITSNYKNKKHLKYLEFPKLHQQDLDEKCTKQK